MNFGGAVSGELLKRGVHPRQRVVVEDHFDANVLQPAETLYLEASSIDLSIARSDEVYQMLDTASGIKLGAAVNDGFDNPISELALQRSLLNSSNGKYMLWLTGMRTWVKPNSLSFTASSLVNQVCLGE